VTVPAYSVRISPKAKHARLRVSAKDGLIVTVPKGFDQSRIPGILHRKRKWLVKVGERFEQQRKFLSPEPPGKVPDRIILRVVGEEWAIDYRATDTKTVAAVERSANRLLVYGNTDNTLACKDALRRWLARKTKEHIVPWVVRLAQERKLEIGNVVVKSQRTRWASCSSKKTISLNLRLFCLPEELVRYVLHHELAHCRYMNHSRQFWAELRSFEPNCERLDAELRTAWRHVPVWLGPSPHQSNKRDYPAPGP
jgi:predicted metal-dependent hydrolase